MTITLVRAVIIYVFVILAVRIMGKRQVGELKPQELVITFLISAVATIPLEENSMPLANLLIPILIFVSLEIIESALSMKSLWFRNLIQGKPIFLIKNGKLQQKELRRLRFTIDDLVDALRQQDAFDISQVENAIVETNGNLSVQLKAEYSPLTPKDMNIKAEKATVPITIVMDGKPVTEYYGSTKIELSEIDLITKSTGVEIQDIMLLNYDSSGNAYLIRKDKK
ncbi:MAG: DUF421 domain-containing protein [Eubacterium sp.]